MSELNAPARDRTAEARRLDDPEAGTILLVVLFVAIAMSGLMFVGGITLKTSKQRSETEFRASGQARNVARAGLVDGYSWFRRQTTQPVTSFAPLRDELANPPILDTEDPAIGLVRHFRISGDIWARYEVRKLDPKNPELAIRDVSLLRGLTGTGQAWHLGSVGYVYRRRDPALAFNESPNEILGSARGYTEIRRITFSPPALAAVNAGRGDQCNIGSRARVRGNSGAGLVYPLATGSPTVTGDVSGTPQWTGMNPVSYVQTPEAIFGVSLPELKSIADDVIHSAANFPSPIPRESLIVKEGDMTFDDTTPLRGTGVIYVNGNVVVDASPSNFFNGLLFANGSITFRAPSLLRGVVICTGAFSMSGVGDYAEIEFDEDVLTSLMLKMGQYRVSKAMRFSDE